MQLTFKKEGGAVDMEVFRIIAEEPKQYHGKEELWRVQVISITTSSNFNSQS